MSSSPCSGLHAPANTFVEFWFDFASNYSYLSAMRIERAAASHGVGVRWRPFLLGPIFRSFGWESSPFVLQPQKGAYVWKDMQRQCLKHRLPWRSPSVFPRSMTLPMKVAAAYADASWVGDFCQACMARNFALDEETNSEEAISAVLATLQLEAAPLLEHALRGAGRHCLRKYTEQAQSKGVFGAPTFFVADEMFWGNDRLEDALASAVAMGRGTT